MKIYTQEEIVELSPREEQGEIDKTSIVRATAVKDRAMRVGAQAGFNQRANELLREIDAQQHNLDKTFNFAALLINGNLLPAVIVERRHNVTQESPQMIRFAGKIFKIESPERFVANPPNWRDYLYTGLFVYKVDIPPDSVLPRNETERVLWKENTQKGWATGALQAEEIFNSNFARLKRDFEGMVRFKILLAKGMATPPKVSRSHDLVSGDRKEMIIDDRIMAVTKETNLETNFKKWQVPSW